MFYPLALASGERFFREGGGKTTLALADAKATSTASSCSRTSERRQTASAEAPHGEA